MTQLEFQLLSEQEQMDLLYTDGVFIGKRRDEETSVLLYQFGVFYVEVFYNKHRCHPREVRCFRSTAHLDPYLENINVGDLVSDRTNF